MGPGGQRRAGRPRRPGCAAAAAREVFQGAPFARGGDVITKVGDTAIANADDLSSAIARFKPGETADVEIHRGGETQIVKVKLDERPLGDRLSVRSLPRGAARVDRARAGYRQAT